MSAPRSDSLPIDRAILSIDRRILAAAKARLGTDDVTMIWRRGVNGTIVFAPASGTWSVFCFGTWHHCLPTCVRAEALLAELTAMEQRKAAADAKWGVS